MAAETKEVKNELESLIHNALLSDSKPLKRAFQLEEAFRTRTTLELDSMRQDMIFANLDDDLEKVQPIILEKFKKDAACISSLNKLFTREGIDVTNITWSLKTNKMENILAGGQALIEKHYFDLCEGNVPEEYEYHTRKYPSITYLGNDVGAKGNSRETYLKAALLPCYLHFHKKLRLQELNWAKVGYCFQFPIFDVKGLWIDKTALAHLTPIPKGIDLSKQLPEFQNCTYSFSDENTRQGLVFLHSGYAFGGHRFETRYPKGKEFGPEDCSSGVALITECGAPISTHDMLFSYRLKTKEGIVKKEWQESRECLALENHFDAVAVKDPTKDIKPGDVYCHRRFGADDPELTKTAGTGGHTALVVGVRSNGTVVTIGYNRDMPKLEGFGIQEFPYTQDKPEPNKKLMIFRSKR